MYRTGSSGFWSNKKNNSGCSQATGEENVPMPVQEMCGKTEKLEDVWEKRRKKAADASTDWVTLEQTCCCHILKRRVRQICTHVAHLKYPWEWLSILRNADRERFDFPLHIKTHSTFNIELIFFNKCRFSSLHTCLYL